MAVSPRGIFLKGGSGVRVRRKGEVVQRVDVTKHIGLCSFFFRCLSKGVG
jgi:hypothetical protein